MTTIKLNRPGCVHYELTDGTVLKHGDTFTTDDPDPLIESGDFVFVDEPNDEEE